MAPLLSLLAFALFALFTTTAASPHIARHVLDHRQHHVVPRVHLDPPVRRRSLNRRCAPSNSTTSPVPSPISSYSPTNSSMTSSTPSSTQPTTAAAPTTTYSPPPPATTYSPPPPATTYSPPPPTTTSTPPPAQTSSSSSNSGEPSYLTGNHTGDGTWFDDGLGACGITSTSSQLIAAVSYLLFDSFPNYDGVNPNTNPVCGMSIAATYQGQSVVVTVVDRCTACNLLDLDFSRSAFSALADLNFGRISIKWEFT